MGERERCILYNNSFFRRRLLPREKKKRERREREKEEKRKEKQESEKRLVRMRTAKHFLRASAWLHRERDRTRLTSQRLFFSFFFLVFCVFSTFALCFLFYCRNDVNDDDDTDAENQFHPRFADKNNTVILYWSILRASG